MAEATVRFIQISSFLFGIIWTTINFYNYYPLIERSLDRTVERLRRPMRDDGRDPREILAAAESLPTIDVFIPAYEESAVIEQPIRTLSRAAYPAENLSIHVLVEPHDETTRETLATLRGQYEFSISTIPTEYPGSPSKPRALNYAFEVTTGDVVTIIDAEDVVGERFLSEVAAAVIDETDFGMARLDMVNEGDGWLNLMFRAEYGYWYNHVVPAFAHVGFPIPLGGTGCFFRRGVLAEISRERSDRYDRVWSDAERLRLDDLCLDGVIPWDPTHLTEDFELGLLLWLQDYEFEYLEATVEEESPVGLDGWLRQRTRWNKGKLQTFAHFLVYRPRSWGRRLHVYWQSMLPHLGPVNLLGLFFVFWVANVVTIDPGPLVTVILALGLTFSVIVSLLYVRGYLVASDVPWSVGARRAVIVGLTVLLYWFLQWLADLIALIDLRRGRVGWNKTAHVGRHLREGEPPSPATGQPHGGSSAGRGDDSDTDGPVRAGAETDGIASVTSGNPTSTALPVPSAIPEVVISKARDAANHDLVSTVSIEYEWPRRRTLSVLSVVLLVGIGIRLAVAGRWGMWLDEIYTVSYRTQLPLLELLYTPHDPHPPLYYVLMAGWIAVFGDTHLVAVAFSLLCSIGVMIGVFVWGRELYDAPTAVVSTGLIALSTMHVHFGRMVRMYSLFSLFVVFSWYYYTRL